jgi:hypothetical protein
MNANCNFLSRNSIGNRRVGADGRHFSGAWRVLLALASLLVGSGLMAQQSLTLSSGQAATLSVSAEGTQPFVYQWRKDGIDLPGATSASFAIPAVSSTDAGAYTVVVSNAAGSTVSDAALLTVEEVVSAPAIVLQPVSVAVTEGATVSFVVGATGSPAPAYRWHKDGVPLSDGGNVSGAATATLSLASVSLADAGIYTLTAGNVAGTATSSGAVLTVSTAATTQKGGGKGANKTSGSGSTDTTSGDGSPGSTSTASPDGLETFEDRVPEGFSVDGYLTLNPKYKKRYAKDPLGAWRNYRDYGIYAGEIYDNRFRALEYLTMYPDVSAFHGTDLRVALLHWLSIGIYEGRLGRFP